MFSWLRRQQVRRDRQAWQRRAERNVQLLRVEELEERRVLTVSGPVANVVTIVGTNASDFIDVNKSTDGLRLVVRIDNVLVSNSILLSSFTKLQIQGLDGDDDIKVTDVPKQLEIDGGADADTMHIIGRASANTFTMAGSGFSLNGIANTTANVEQFVFEGQAASDLFIVQSGVTSVTSLLGAGGSDRLQGSNAGSFFNLVTTNAGIVDSSIGYNDIENLTGGTGTDTFFFSSTATLSGRIDGGGGGDTLDYNSFYRAIRVSLFSRTASAIGGFDNIESIVGSSFTGDTLVGARSNNLWKITGNNQGDVNGVMFDGFENVVGNTLVDTFEHTIGGSIDGSIDGQGGVDVFDYTIFLDDVSVSLASGAADGCGAFLGIERFIGGSDEDDFYGPNANSVWTITSQNAGTVAGVSFENFENLRGGTQADRFVFLNGASITADVDGGAGLNGLDYTNYGLAITVNLEEKEANNIGGFFDNIQQFYGSSAFVDTLIAPNVVNTWNITQDNAGSVAASQFARFDNLTGGTSTDTFKLANGVKVRGVINGGAGLGTDILDYSAYTTAIVVNLETAAATNTGGIANLEGVVGGIASDRLIGHNSVRAWTLTGANSGSISDLALYSFYFASIENLTGGTSTDFFNMQAGSSLSGRIDGGGGFNSIDYATFDRAVQISLRSRTATGTGGFDRIDFFSGSSFSDNFVGPLANNQWNLTAINEGSVAGVLFAEFENLFGNTMADRFTFSDGAGVSGRVEGRGGLNALDYSAYTTSVSVELGAGTATNVAGGISNDFTEVYGGSEADTLTGGNGDDFLFGNDGGDIMAGGAGNNVLVGGAGVDVMDGGMGRDILIGGLDGDVMAGGGGEDILIGGYTLYDANLVALRAIAAEWKSARTYNQRTANISNSPAGVRLNAGFFLIPTTTVLDDGAIDNLTGQNGRDWYFLRTGQDIGNDIGAGGLERADEI